MKKHFKYLSYVVRHKWFVFIECIKLGIPWRGFTHDLSKFLPSEWIPYTNYFYGADDIEKGKYPQAQVEAEFDAAWLKHQHRNKHHWQHWLLTEDSGKIIPIAMPRKYAKEMLADWRGAGKAQGFKELGPWYKENQHRIVLHEKTRAFIHALMTPEEQK